VGEQQQAKTDLSLFRLTPYGGENVLALYRSKYVFGSIEIMNLTDETLAEGV
jgi:hypothetical protein